MSLLLLNTLSNEDYSLQGGTLNLRPIRRNDIMLRII